MKRKYLAISLFFLFLTGVFSVQNSDAQVTAGNSGYNQSQNSYFSQIVSGILNIASVTVNYQIRGGSFLNTTLDEDTKSVILAVNGYNTTLSVDEYGPHYLELWIPHELLDTQPGDNFTVSINGKTVAVDQALENIEPRWIVIKYQTGDNIISITGTRTIYDLVASENHITNQTGTSGSPNAQNNIQSSPSNNNLFSAGLISAIAFAAVIAVAAIFIIRSLVRKKARLDLEIVRANISKSNGNGATITVELKIHNKGGVRTTVHELACKIQDGDKKIEIGDDNKSITQVDFHSTVIPEPIKFSLSKNKIHVDPDTINEITLIVRHTHGLEIIEHVHVNKDKSDNGSQNSQ